MKMKTTLLLVGATSFLLGAPLAFADTGHPHSHEVTQETPPDSHSHDQSVEEMLASLDNTVTKISTTISVKELSKLHDLTEEVSHLASHIAEKVPADKQARVSGSAKNISTIANNMHSAADKADQAGVEASLKRLQGMMLVLKGQLK